MQSYAPIRAIRCSETARIPSSMLLILDTRLPDIDGITLCRRLREQRIISADAPRVVMTTSVQATRASSHRRFCRWRVGFLPAAGGRRFCLRIDTFVRASGRPTARRRKACSTKSTGLYNFRGMARRARETGAEALRVRGAMACVALAPVIDDAPRGRRVGRDPGQGRRRAPRRGARPHRARVRRHRPPGSRRVRRHCAGDYAGRRGAADGTSSARTREHRWFRSERELAPSAYGEASSPSPTIPTPRSMCSRCSSAPPRRLHAQHGLADYPAPNTPRPRHSEQSRLATSRAACGSRRCQRTNNEGATDRSVAPSSFGSGPDQGSTVATARSSGKARYVAS